MVLTCPEDLSAAVTARGELGVIARAAEYLVHLGSKLFVHEGHLALVAQETFLMPVLVLVRQILEHKNIMLVMEKLNRIYVKLLSKVRIM